MYGFLIRVNHIFVFWFNSHLTNVHVNFCTIAFLIRNACCRWNRLWTGQTDKCSVKCRVECMIHHLVIRMISLARRETKLYLFVILLMLKTKTRQTNENHLANKKSVASNSLSFFSCTYNHYGEHSQINPFTFFCSLLIGITFYSKLKFS